jgi:nucleotide-binding universal stress UspA family protein
VIDLGPRDNKNVAHEKTGEVVRASAAEGAKANDENAALPGADETPVVLVNEKPDTDLAEEIIAELPKGYDMIFLGADGMLEHGGKGKEESSLAKILQAFEGVTAVALSKKGVQADELDILLPLIGTDYSRRAAEVAVALAKGANSALTAFHVTPPVDEVEVLRRSDAVVESGRKLVRDIKDLGKSEAVKIRTLLKVRKSAETAILSQVKRGKHTLIVVGVKFRGDNKNISFGTRISVLIEKMPCSILIVNS